MKRIFYYFLINGLFGAGVYFAYFEGVEGAERCVMFYTWVTAIISLAYFHDDVIAQMKEKGRCMPKFIDMTYDISIIGIMLWFGSIVTACAYTVHFILHTSAWEKVEKLNSE